MSWWVFNKKTKAVTEGINANHLMTEIARGNVAGAIITGDWFGWLEDAS